MKTWVQTTIGEIAEVVSGATPSTTVKEYWDGDVPWVTPKDLSSLGGSEISNTARSITAAGLRSCAASVLPANSVLLSSRAPIGLVAINRVPMATNQGLKSLVPDHSRVESRFLYWWLKAHRSLLESLGNGATFKEISKRSTSAVRISLPPIEDQRRISAVLDAADALRTKRRQAVVKLDALAQSVFLDMFGNPHGNSGRWPVVTIGDVLKSATYGTSRKSGDAGEYAVLRMGNLTSDGRIDVTDLKYTDLTGREREQHVVTAGDALFNRTNSAELVGKTAVYRSHEPMAYAGYLVRLRPGPRVHAEYLGAFMNLPGTKRVLRSMCKSIIGMANINAKEVQGLKMPLPPIDLQGQFAAYRGPHEVLRTRMEQQLHDFEALFASLQHRAFRGEL